MPKPSLTKGALVLALSASLTGCYDRLWVHPSELQYLSGFDIHNERSVVVQAGRYASTSLMTDRPYRLVTPNGEPIDFNSRTGLKLHLDSGLEIDGPFLSLAIEDGILSARTPDGPLRVPLRSVSGVEVKRYSTGKTGALLIALGLGVGATIAGGMAAMVATQKQP
jgi:hypothetical protein